MLIIIDIRINWTTKSKFKKQSGHLNIAPGAPGHLNIAPGAPGHLNAAPGYLSTSSRHLNTDLILNSGYLNTALGHLSTASGNLNIALGHVNTASGHFNTTSGHVNTTSGHFNTGHFNTASGHVNTASGHVNTASGHVNSALWYVNTASGYVNNTASELSRHVNATRHFPRNSYTNTDIVIGALDSAANGIVIDSLDSGIVIGPLDSATNGGIVIGPLDSAADGIIVPPYYETTTIGGEVHMLVPVLSLGSCSGCSLCLKKKKVPKERKILKCMFENCLFKTTKTTNFRNHYRIHTGERPFKCSYCPYDCNNISGLRTHIKRRHKETQFII